ncbi:translocating chain-associated membrane protein 1-like 1 isoform X1 [Oncorhynchus nerka]|uniref:translocating chain-associated membrane protein 1-like 1 isoform X1 n=1 Tax=Oncorhynchus nerka TaxID=8023 RepID=UPI0011321F4E|nr:translocating chain-associated membrane protein 1-like 1 isoform X1 [Oncorhynchus nerka]XP_046221197.1 translocating chain-associated membrane protein 1-like 1-like isoform X1 [Oncorhynchus gorbuscha]
MGFRKKNKSPPVLSHEFVIQNHADMVSCVAMIILLGLMFEVTAKFAIMFITIQYNVTQSLDERAEQVNLYQYGPKDIATVFFYLLIAVILHALIQEYILDKMNRRLHLSKTKHSKFNESGQLAAFYLLSFIWGCSILTAEEFATNPTFLWEGYPHTHMVPDLCLPVTCPLCSFQVKFFYICQIAYWLHALPELYFQKVRKEDIPRQLYYICLYVFHITGAYILNLHRLGLVLLVPHYLVELLFHASRLFYFSDENKQKGFTLWALLFVIARLLTLTLSVLTFGFGLPRAENQGFSLAKGNFNVLTIRMTCLAAICLTQAWMMWKFINFQLKKWREHSQSQASKKKAFSPKSKPHKKDLARVGSANGVVKSDDKTSPRARKAKAS